MNRPPRSAQVLRLVPVKARASLKDSADTVEALASLLAKARCGGLVGLVFGVERSGGGFLIDAAGSCLSDPVRARGMVATIDDHLAELVRGRTDA